MPTSSYTPSGGSTFARPRSSYSSTFVTTGPSGGRYGRALPPGPGPLDRTGKPLTDYKTRTSTISTGPIRADHKVTYETTHRLEYESSRSSSINEIKGGSTLTDRTNDSFGNIYGRRKDSLDTSYKPHYGARLYNIGSGSGTSTGTSSKYNSSGYNSDTENTTPGGSLSRRRSSITDKISQFESSYRNTGEPITTGRAGSSQSGSHSTSPTSHKDNSGLTGLRNLRNTCFMNCILQCLSNTKPLLEYCLKDEFILDTNDKASHMRGQLIRAYANLMKDMWKKNGDSSLSPTAFKSAIAKYAPRFVGYSQQDSQEFLRYLLEGLHEDVNRVTSRPKLPIISEEEDNKLSKREKPKFYWDRYVKLEKSVIVDIFVGQLRSTLKCTDCAYESTTYDPFWDLSLPIPKYSSNVQLSDCIRLFTQEEVLDGDEKPTCARCKARRKCTKRFSIQRFPQTLVLHLKRFSGERFRSKLTTSVSFPLADLDLSQFAADSQGSANSKYNCIGVSNHSGTVFSGHYTAYCKHPYREDWHEYNDQSVRPVPTRSIVSAEAYVLFFELSKSSSSRL